MDIKLAFAIALKKVRKVRRLTQEDFSDTSSRTYISTLERGKKSITLEKLEQLAQTLRIHPLTLLAITYANVDSNIGIKELLRMIEVEVDDINGNQAKSVTSI